ncbi:MAG: acyl-CoA thioesterase [Chloroflexi bacterium]|nr:acyl-CoA thioesterase [Chloroflexota bacterium]MBI3731901.1 acyl-CoA thioesterase [Chloroflexota bacterium]
MRRYELNTLGQVAPAVYFNWLEHAVFRAGESRGWTPQKMQAENLIILQRRHDAEFFAPARYRDAVEIVSALVEVRRVRGTWRHEVFNAASGALLMRDYSEGAFLDLPKVPHPHRPAGDD